MEAIGARSAVAPPLISGYCALLADFEIFQRRHAPLHSIFGLIETPVSQTEYGFWRQAANASRCTSAGSARSSRPSLTIFRDLDQSLERRDEQPPDQQ